MLSQGGRDAREAFSLAALLHSALPLTPVVLLVSPICSGGRNVDLLARLSVVLLLPSSPEQLATDFRHVLTATYAAPLHRLRLSLLTRGVSPPLVDVVTGAIPHLVELGNVSGFARLRGLSARTLHRQLVSVGSPPPGELLDWIRLLWVACHPAEPSDVRNGMLAGALESRSWRALVARRLGATALSSFPLSLQAVVEHFVQSLDSVRERHR
ncbi:MAG: hypothetical protein H0W68_00075 [Gemmatimonadaceae bacterium]|nr:hypothetical protein [Gemmatimonadaceae bacterium]